jgi:site-specific DNA-methyltransferase (adenine-specific)
MNINGDILDPGFVGLFGNKKYQHIIADPAWKYSDRRAVRKDGGKTRLGIGIEHRYDGTISTDALCKIKVQALAAASCHLHLWAVCPLIQDAITVMNKWGFKYATVEFVWVKMNRGKYRDNMLFSIDDWRDVTAFLPGFYTGSNIELVLLGTRGRPFRHADGCKDSQVIFAPNGEHSRKPDDVHKRIDHMYPDGNKLELFARRPYHGWDCFGNQL